MKNIRIETRTNKALVYTPYNRKFVEGIHNIGSAKWDARDRAWSVDIDDVEEVQTLLKNIFGTDGTSTVECCTLKIKAKKDIYYDEKLTIYLGTTPLVQAFGRDTGAKVAADNVSLLSGNITSGGSKKYPNALIEKDAIFKIKQFPVSQLSEIDSNLWEILEKTSDKKANDEKVQHIIKLSQEADQKLNELAEAQGKTISEIIEHLILLK